MQWQNYSRLKDCHAFLGASKYQWLNYDSEKLNQAWINNLAKQRGTELHDLASRCIKLKQKLPKSNKTLNAFVNDAIGYRMQSEQVLFYSDNCFGTADAISFNKNLLRIHDLKTGVTPAHMEQLMIYAALFCLNYHIKPGEIDMELRIYQNDDIAVYVPTGEEIAHIIDKIITFDKQINKLKEQED